MTDALRKRALAGPTMGEKRQEEATPENHGKKKASVIQEPKWVKLTCGTCGFLMGYRFHSKYYCSNHVGHRCLGCQRKAEVRTAVQ